MPPAITGTSIASAVLQLYVVSVKTAGDLTIHAVTSPWSEHFTGKTVPAPTTDPTVLATIPAAEIAKKDFVTVDITPAIAVALTSGSFDGLAIEASGATSVTFASKEGPASGYAAQLVIDAALGSTYGQNTSTPIDNPVFTGTGTVQGTLRATGSGVIYATTATTSGSLTGPVSPAQINAPIAGSSVDATSLSGNASALAVGEANYSGFSFPLGQAGEFVATWGDDATGMRASGTDYLSAISAVQHPFKTGTGAQAVVQPYDEMLFSTGTFSGFTYTAVNGEWIRGSGCGSLNSAQTGFIGGTVFTDSGQGFWAQTSGASAKPTPVDGLRWSDFATTVSIGTEITTGTIPNQFTNIWMSNIKALGHGRTGDELVDLYAVSGGVVDRLTCAQGGQAFVVKGNGLTITNFVGINNNVSSIVIKNPGYNNGGTGAAYYAANDIVDHAIISSTYGGGGIVLDDFSANNNPAMSNILIENSLFTMNAGAAIGIQCSGTFAPVKGLNFVNDVCSGGPVISDLDYGLPVYGRATNCVTENAAIGFYGDEPITFSNCTAENCGAFAYLHTRTPDVFAAFPNCTAENCSVALFCIDANRTYTFQGPLAVTGTYGAFSSQNAGGASFSILPNLYQWWRNNGYVAVTSETSLLTGFAGYGYGSTTVPLPIMQQHPIIADVKGSIIANGTTSFTFKWYDGGNNRVSSTIVPPSGTTGFTISAQTAIRYSLNILDGDMCVNVGGVQQNPSYTAATTPSADEVYDLTVTASDANSTIEDIRATLKATDPQVLH